MNTQSKKAKSKGFKVVNGQKMTKWGHPAFVEIDSKVATDRYLHFGKLYETGVLNGRKLTQHEVDLCWTYHLYWFRKAEELEVEEMQERIRSYNRRA